MMNKLISEILFELGHRVSKNVSFHVDIEEQNAVAEELKEIAELLEKDKA